MADVDATFARAVAAGATTLRPVEDQFHGSRSGQLLDPFGHRWTISTQIEELTLEEMHRRAEERSGDGADDPDGGSSGDAGGA